MELERKKLKEDFDQPTNDNGSLQSDEGEGQVGKRAQYEPKPASERCKQIVCSQGRAIFIAVIVALVIVIIALIAAFTRAPSQCPVQTIKTTPLLHSAPTMSTTPPPGMYPWTDILLPRTIEPLSYDIEMHPDLKNFTFRGSESIRVRVLEPTDWIIFHVEKLALENTKVMSALHHPIAIVKTLEYKQNQQFMIQVDRQLQKEEVLTIMLEFSAPLSTGMSGFYLSSYKSENGEKKYLATTHFEPTDARAAFPCFDEPALKANFTMSIVREKRHIALFNMPKKSTEPYGGDPKLEIDRFEPSVKMSTYLVAFVVCDFKSLTTKTKSNVTVSVYAPPHLISQAQFAVDAAKTILEYYDDYFGIKYPLPKQDLIAIPDFAAGAMENWGLITYRMTSILWDKKQSSTRNKQIVAVVIAHELAHQWFGNLVTMKWWNDLWLNEGFASYVEFIGTNEVDKDWHMFDQFVIDQNLAAMNLDSLSNSHPISVTVTNPSQINEIFDTISYDKGSSIIRMLDSFLGPGVMQKGLKSYLNKYQFSNAETKDLWNSFSEASQQLNVSEIMDTWTLQMGYPVVTVTRKGSNIQATQQHFLLNQKAKPSTEFKSPFEYKWHVPLTYVTDAKPTDKTTVWMKLGPASFTIPANAKWFKANVNTTGFYRVNYDSANWHAIIEQLRSDFKVFTAADRAGLIDDAFSLARAGHIDQITPLNLSHYLAQEDEYVPWNSAVQNFHYLNRVLADLPEGYDLYKKYVLKLIRRSLDDVGWEEKDKSKSTSLRVYLRSMLLSLALKLGDKKTITEGKKRFEAWKTNPGTISADLKDVIYHAGIADGDEENWNYCWEQYNTTHIPSEKSRLLYALSTTKDGVMLNKYLQFSIDETKVRAQDTVAVIVGIASNQAGKYAAWRFVQQHWDLLVKRYGSGSFDMTKLILAVPSQFTTQFDLDQVVQFYTSVKVGSGARATHQVIETIQMNIDWLKKYQVDVVDWLRRNAA